MLTIPYFQVISFSLGPITVYVWGLFVALGVTTSFLLVHHLLRNNKKFQENAEKLFLLVVIAGIIGSRLGHVLFYEWGYYRSHLLDIFKVWEGGLSSYGGFLGAAVPIMLYWKKYTAVTMQKIIAVFTLAFPWGWGIGRLGCFLIHDHPGAPCPGCVLALRYSDGSLRPDLGLYDALLAFLIGGILYTVNKKELISEKTLFPVLVFLYSIPRFFLDFLRAYPPFGDARYAGLTPAQYGSVLLCIIAGIYIFKKKS